MLLVGHLGWVGVGMDSAYFGSVVEGSRFGYGGEGSGGFVGSC